MPSREALRDYYTDQIHQSGYVSVNFPVKGSDIDPLFSSFRQLIDEVWEKPTERSQDIVDAFKIKHPSRPGDSAGFIEQRRKGQFNPYEPGRAAATEDKDLLHFTPLTVGHVRKHLRTRGGIPHVARELIGRCEELHEEIKHSLRPVFQALDLDRYLLSPYSKEHRDVHVLRVIHYLGSEATESFRGDDLAQLHFDRSKFTAAVWESSTGLVGAPGNNGTGDPALTVEDFDWLAEQAIASPIRHRSGSIKLFAGAGYNRLPEHKKKSSGNLPLLLHGVTNDNPSEPRDAVVLFMNQAVGMQGSVPETYETGFDSIRNHLEERQRRLGGLVAQSAMAKSH